MKQAIISLLIVLVCGYFGCFLDFAGCIIASEVVMEMFRMSPDKASDTSL